MSRSIALMTLFCLTACDDRSDELKEAEARVAQAERELAEARQNTIASGIAELERQERGLPPTPRSVNREHLTSTLSSQQEEDLALAVNLSGNLCGRVVGAQVVGSKILLECQEYRRKAGHYVRYWVRDSGEGQSMQVEKAYVLRVNGWTRMGKAS